jgi:hypothetical protein
VPKFLGVGLKWAVLAAAGLSFVVLAGNVLWSRFHVERASARHLALSSARAVASNIDTHLDELKDLLSEISVAVSTNPEDRDANDMVLRRIQSELPKSIANIFVLTLDGSNIGNAVGKHAFAGDREYFKSALASDRVVVGAPIRSRSDLGWVIPMAQPVFDGSGKLQAVLTIAIFTDSLRELIASCEIPKGAVVRVVTEGGIEIARFSSQTSAIESDDGRMGSPGRQFRLTEGSEAVNLHSNLTRIVGFSRTRRASWMVTVGLPVEARPVSGAELP